MAEGYLKEVQSYDTRVGTMYSLVFDNGDKLGVGKFAPKHAEPGEYYEYEIEMRGQYKNLKQGSLRKKAKPQGVPQPKAAASGGGGQSYDSRQEVISRQSALNSALALVDILVKADALPVPKSAKTDKKADLITDIVRHYTAEYYEQSTGNKMVLSEKEEASLADDLSQMEADDGEWN